MDNGNEAISIFEFNEKLKSVLFSKSLLPKDSSDIKYYYMELLDDEGKLRSMSKYHNCSEDYLEYYWVEFMYNGKEFVVSLFYRDFDLENGDIHVIPGALQVWEKEDNTGGVVFMFPNKSKGTKPYMQAVKQSSQKQLIWKPLIDCDDTRHKQFIMAPYFDVSKLRTIIYLLISGCNLKIEVINYEESNVGCEVKVSDNEAKLHKNNDSDEELKNLSYYLVEVADEEMMKKFKIEKGAYKVLSSTYKYLYRWTHKTYNFYGSKYFICPYKHINTDYGYFIRFDGTPTAYQVNYDKGTGFPNKLNEKTNCFEIGYDYANAVDVINASKNE